VGSEPSLLTNVEIWPDKTRTPAMRHATSALVGGARSIRSSPEALRPDYHTDDDQSENRRNCLVFQAASSAIFAPAQHGVRVVIALFLVIGPDEASKALVRKTDWAQPATSICRDGQARGREVRSRSTVASGRGAGSG
jgi:hypothetical protein